MWKDKYRIGVERIDEQHRELFKRLSNFIQIVQDHIPWEGKMNSVKETMEFMKEYVEYHFDDEEMYQKQISYPGIGLHIDAHRKFKEGIHHYAQLFERGQFTESKVQEFSAKLMTWLIMHVGKMDQQIGEYVRTKEGMD